MLQAFEVVNVQWHLKKLKQNWNLVHFRSLSCVWFFQPLNNCNSAEGSSRSLSGKAQHKLRHCHSLTWSVTQATYRAEPGVRWVSHTVNMGWRPAADLRHRWHWPWQLPPIHQSPLVSLCYTCWMYLSCMYAPNTVCNTLLKRNWCPWTGAFRLALAGAPCHGQSEVGTSLCIFPMARTKLMNVCTEDSGACGERIWEF